MAVVRGGKITPYTWTDADGKRHKSWRWSVNVGGKQQRRQGYSTKAEAEVGFDAYKAELVAPKAKLLITLVQAFEKYFEAKARKRSLAGPPPGRAIEGRVRQGHVARRHYGPSNLGQQGQAARHEVEAERRDAVRRRG